MASICVFCSSSNSIADIYPPVARTLGQQIARRNHTLIYGGGAVGLMGVLARAMHEEGGKITGVIPSKLQDREGIAYEADELIVTETMRERKRIMYQQSDAFVVLPGGFGTVEEFMEVLTLKQLGYHAHPIALVNTDGFFNRLLGFFEHLHANQFAHTDGRDLLKVTSTPEEALAHLDASLTTV